MNVNHCRGVFSLVFENTSQSGRSFVQMKGPSTYRRYFQIPRKKNLGRCFFAENLGML
jgi:hypothetical protein